MLSAIAAAVALWSVAVAASTLGLVAPPSSFDHHGRVATIGGLAWGSGQERTAVTGTGDIYAAAAPGNGPVQVRRYLRDGEPDRSFGFAGTTILGELGEGFRMSELLVDTDGSPYLVGKRGDGELDVVRLGPTGALDPSYGEDGIARLGTIPPTAPRARATIDQQNRVIVATAGDVDRLDPTGKLDPTFGTGGSVPLPDPDVEGLGVDEEGRVQLALPGENGKDFRLMRLEADGRPNPGLGPTGIRTFKGIGAVRAMAVRADGSTLIVGTASRHRRSGSTVPLLSIGSRGARATGGRWVHSFSAHLRRGTFATGLLADPNGDDYLIAAREVIDLEVRPERSFSPGDSLDSFGMNGRVALDEPGELVARGASITGSGQTLLVDGIARPRPGSPAHGFLVEFPAAEHVITYTPEPAGG